MKNIKEILEELSELFEKEGAYYQLDQYMNGCENAIVISVNWGDWKHDHLWLESKVNNYLLRNNILFSHEVIVTEENGSDTYSADHVYTLNGKFKYGNN